MLISRIGALLVMAMLLGTFIVSAQGAQMDNDGADLSTEILSDKYILTVRKALEEKNYPNALKFIKKLENLGGDIPPSVDYFLGEVYLHTKRYDEGMQVLNRYLAKTGKEGRYYEKTLELMIAAEEEREAEEVRAKAIADAQEKAKRHLEQEMKLLVKLINTPYKGKGTAKWSVQDLPVDVKYEFFYKVNAWLLSSTTIHIESSNLVYSRQGKYKRDSRTYETGMLGIPVQEVDGYASYWDRASPKEYHSFDALIDFTKIRPTFAKFGRIPCIRHARLIKCPSNRPYFVLIGQTPIVHTKHHIDAIYNKLLEIEKLCKKAGYRDSQEQPIKEPPPLLSLTREMEMVCYQHSFAGNADLCMELRLYPDRAQACARGAITRHAREQRRCFKAMAEWQAKQQQR
ncbi:MAG: tetratricopeptide repeat protein [Nitrospira sp. SB0661_bin_20]|nr:tetratricopeptide repeat protein [Nitrospira sp. SB0661_bin_20]